MKRLPALIITILIFYSCQQAEQTSGILVKNQDELNKAIAEAKPGDEIIMADGEWNDIQIRFVGYGTESQPISLKAETAGNVKIQGASDLKLGGEYLVVDGLLFTNGASPSRTVIQFAINNDTVANHCRVTNTAIIDFNKAQRNMSDLWVRFKGRHNQLDHCYLAGKSNRGPTIRIDLEGNQSIKNYHRINNNHFGPRPPKGGPSAETIQLGNSSTSMVPSYTLVENNLFDRCNGEVEVISSKSNFNEFRNNVFYKSEGSLVTRHGNYCIIDGNYFIGDENNEQIGGVRLIGTGHWVTNNYFYKLKGQVFRSPLAVMNGIRKSPINRYIQVTDVVVAYNSWIDCVSPWQFGVGSNVDQKDVLPASEIRSERPIRTIVANNLIYNSEGDANPIVRHDSIDGINFRSNIINNQGAEFMAVDGLDEKDFELTELEENIWRPASDLADVQAYEGFEFKEMMGATSLNSIGASAGNAEQAPNLMDQSKYGPDWFDAKAETPEGKVHRAATVEELSSAVENAKDGDRIELIGESYELAQSLSIDQKLFIQSSSSASISYSGEAGTAAFEMNPKGELTLEGIQLSGNGENYAFASLKENMSSLYNLTVKNSEISNFDYMLKAYKYSFSEYIRFESVKIKNCNNGLELSAEDDDRGEYNAENVFIVACDFADVQKNVIDYYRGGYDESTVGGNLQIRNSSFTRCGGEEENGTLLNTYGIINVDLRDNVFTYNNVKLIARLWGAKNNSESGNRIENGGRIITEQNLPLKLMY